jgi:hypothetical protein
LGGDVCPVETAKNDTDDCESVQIEAEKDEYIRFSSDSFSEDDILELDTLTCDEKEEKEATDPFAELDFVVDDFEDFNPNNYDKEDRSLEYFQVFSTDFLNDSTNAPSSSSSPSPEVDIGQVINVDAYKQCSKRRKNSLNLKRTAHFQRYTVKNTGFSQTDVETTPSYEYIYSKYVRPRLSGKSRRAERVLLRFDPTRPFRRN